jgi:hypothetical protein
MKIKVEFELTPEELRESLGLPDISGLQNEALSMLQKRISTDIEDIDVGKVIESWFSQGIAASRKVQELIAAAASGILDHDSGEPEASARKKRRKKKSED